MNIKIDNIGLTHPFRIYENLAPPDFRSYNGSCLDPYRLRNK